MKFEKEYNHFYSYYSNFIDAISIINKDGYLVYMNYTVTGKIEDFIGKNIEELNIYSDKSVNQKIFDLIENGVPFTTEYEIEYQGINSNFKSNNFRIDIAEFGVFVVIIINFEPFSKLNGKVAKEDWKGIYDIYQNPLINSNNVIENVIGFVDDKTQIAKYQKQIEFQSLILNNINDIVICLDDNLKIIYWNEVAEKTYGFTSNQTMGKRIEEFYSYRWIDDTDLDKSLKSIKQNGYWKGEIIHITKEGKEIYIETNTTNIIDKNGEFKGLLAVNRDITTKKESEYALIRNKYLTDTIFDNSPTAIQVYDADGYSVRMNEAHMKYIGLPDITVGVGVYNILQDENIKYTGLNRFFERAFKGEIVEVKGQLIDFSNYDGTWSTHSQKRYIDLSILPLLDVNNNISSVVSFITDITESYENEQKLIESEAQFRLLTENTSDLIINYNSDGKITYVSPSIKRVLGYDVNELLQTEYLDWFSSKNLTKIGNNFGDNFILGNELVNVEYKILNKKGNYLYLDTLIKPIINEVGELINVITYSRDITERVTNELKLQETNRLMNAMSEIANIGGWELDLDTQSLIWTDQVYIIYGIKNDEKPLLEEAIDYFVGDSKLKILDAIELAINSKIPYNLTLRFKDAKGNLKWVRTNGFPYIENEKVSKIYGIFQDVTESYEKDKIIRENESLLKSINSNINEALYRSTPDRGILYANKATLKMFGFDSLEEMNNFGPLNNYPERRNEIINLLNKFGEVKKIENLYRKKDGSTFWGLNSSFQSLDENGEIIYDGAIVDITEIKEKEELLNNLNQNLELMVEERTNELRLTQEKLLDSFTQEKEYLELKSKFITLVSHEYRTPLTIIQTSLYLLEKFYEKGKTEQFQSQISRINDAIESMTVLLDNVLTLGTYDLNSVKKYLQEIDAIKLITEIIEMQLQINKNSVNINFYSDLPNLIMLTDKTMVYQIINNLIENSIKYSGGNKNIDVFIELINFTEFNGFNRNVKFNEDINEDINEDTNEVIYKNNRKYLRFIVKDYGIGISKENIEKISEPFFRGENVNEIRGLGLGLSISKTWVKILEGSLIFESEEGKYTVATLELPIFYPKEIS